MAISGSGTLSLNEFHIEAGGTSGTTCSINDSDIRGMIDKGDGATMSFNEWYGASSYTGWALSGGTDGGTSGNFKYRYFNSSGQLNVQAVGTSDNANPDYIIIAGGASGGPQYDGSGGGGGGAGGYITGTFAPSTTGNIAVTVGAGGSANQSPTDGNNSSISGVATATGGGAGGTHNQSAQSGGSGGGGSGSYGSNSGAGGISGQGRSGGSGNAPNGQDVGGGGGGKGNSGGNAGANRTGTGGAGGNGSTTGNANYNNAGRAGGGGGGSRGGYGGAGDQGGGNGGQIANEFFQQIAPYAFAQSGTANTGGGGGGGVAQTSYAPGGISEGAGGSGIVMVRYQFQI